MTYGIQYDFDEQGEPPQVCIADNGGLGTRCVLVYEEPTSICGEWTRNDDAWQPGPLAKRLMECMNAKQQWSESGDGSDVQIWIAPTVRPPGVSVEIQKHDGTSIRRHGFVLHIGCQSFPLQHRVEDPVSAEWYAGQLCNALLNVIG